MELRTFRGGIHPPYQKEATEHKAIEEIAPPSEVVIPLLQHVGAPCDPLVNVGDHVETGQMIGNNDAVISASVHASYAGQVKAIEEVKDFSGDLVKSVVISVDAPPPAKSWAPRSVEGATQEEIRSKAREAGLVGLGGAGFPTAVKITPPADKPIDTVIINGCECEPYLNCDHRVMLERADEMISGLRLLMKAVGASRGIIGVEANKMDAVEEMEKKTAGEADLSVTVCDVKYPEGAEKMLIKALTDREVPPGKLPSEVGVLVQNVQTAVALYEALAMDKPLIQRVLTVTGPGIREPKNVLVGVGVTVDHVVQSCGGFVGTPGKVIMGGPMTGWAQDDLAVSVIKGTSGIVVLTRDLVAELAEQECVGCDKCLDACPLFLMPNYIVKHTKRGQYEKAKLYGGAEECFECGCCSYVCPSAILHVAYVRKAKKELAIVK